MGQYRVIIFDIKILVRNIKHQLFGRMHISEIKTQKEIFKMMHYRIMICGWLIFVICKTAAAYDIQQGIHGMNWGSSISDYDNLSEVHKSKQATYYSNSDMLFQVANRPVPAVHYGFYRNQFFAVFIKLRSADQFVHLQRQFSVKHGAPKRTFNESTRQTVYRWIDADVKIKLKMIESNADYRLAIYYAPLAAAFNEEQLESIPPGAFNLTPAKEGKPVKTAPLLNF